MRHLALAIVLSCGCGSDSAGSGGDLAVPSDLAVPGSSDLGVPPLGDPIAATPGQWTWVDFPDSFCDDGTTTGLGVNPSSAGSNVLVYFAGGGACWDYVTCLQLNTAVHGPFGKTQFDTFIGSLPPGTLFDRNDAQNPFRDFSLVLVPYCTGDEHAGDHLAMYAAPNDGGVTAYHHVGHANVLAYLKRLGATFLEPAKLVVSGSSAGGYGALYNYLWFRRYWPQPEMYLLDDSGPPLEPSVVPPADAAAMSANWRIGELLGEICSGCESDSSLTVPALASTFPTDRLALLSSLQDQTIRSYLQLSGAAFQSALQTMAADRFDPTAHARYFFVAGATHTMLGNPAAFTSQTTPLPTWLAQLIGDDPAWASTTP